MNSEFKGEDVTHLQPGTIIPLKANRSCFMIVLLVIVKKEFTQLMKEV